MDRPQMIFYQSSVVTAVSLSYAVFRILILIYQNLKKSRDLNTPNSG